MLAPMDRYRLGSVLRAVRRRTGRRQVDVARQAGVSDATVSRIERGELDTINVEVVQRVARAVGVRVEWVARWRGAELDRMLNERHAAMHEAVVPWLERCGWEAVPEVSFSVYGERGVVDVLAVHHDSRHLLVVELKTALVDVQALIGTVDRYRRLAPRMAADRGWAIATTSVWVVLADGRTNRRRVAAHARVLRSAFPSDGRLMGRWLLRPQSPVRALSFLPDRLAVTVRRGTGGATRVRVPRASVASAGEPAEPSR